MISTLVIATHNAKKAGEMVTILSARFPKLRILTLADFPGAPEPEESGATYAENAVIKAQSGAEFTGHWCLADDAGLEIDALPGELGPLSKRFEGENTTFEQKMAVILDRMKDVPLQNRGARFQCFVALAPAMNARQSSDALETPDKVITFSATCEGRIAFEPSGKGGFGYDPIFFLPALGCCMADLTPEQKHAISHRGKVLKAFGDWLEKS